MSKSDPIVIGQHFVYRHYLDQWSESKKIYAYVNGKITHQTNRNIGKKRYFYKLGVPNDREVDMLKLFFLDSRYTNNISVEFNASIINPYLKISSLYKRGDRSKDVKTFMHNAIEKIHMMIENDFDNILPRLLKKDQSCFSIDDDRMYLIVWIAVQQLRTFSVKDKILSKITNTDFTASWPLFSLLFSYNIGLSVWMEKPQRKIFYIENNTEVEFLTTDQPVINIDANDAERAPDKFSWYYPITPRLALFVPEIGTHKDISDNELTIEKVDYLNDFMIKFSGINIFSKSRKTLERYNLV